MAFDVDRFARLRPYLYHITARANRTAIERSMLLEPAAQLMRRAARPDLLRWRRPEAVTIRVGPDEIVLKDQRPLIEANLSLDGSWELGDLVEYLNEHVFFWPGRADGPIVHGARLLDRYEADAPRSESLLACGPVRTTRERGGGARLSLGDRAARIH